MPQDSTITDTTQTHIDGDSFRRWPVRTVQDWLALQPGVAVRYPGQSTIYIRGGRDFNSAWLLNSARIENPMSGRSLATISPFAIGDLSLQTAGFGGQPGDFIGGVVSANAPAASNRIAGSVEVTSDYFGSGFDQNWYNATLMGPLGDNTGLDFFASSERRYFGDRRPSPIAEEVLPDGEKALPGNTLEGWSHHGKVSWAPCDKGRITVWGDYSRNNYQTYLHQWYYYPEHSPRTQDEMLSLGFGIERELSKTVALDLKAKYYGFERIHGDGVYFDDLEAYEDKFETYDMFQLFAEEGGPYGLAYNYLLKQKSTYLELDASLSFIPAEKHEVTVGFDARRYTIRQIEYLLPGYGFAYFRVNNYGYDSLGVETDDDSWMDGVKHPVRGGLYVQDRVKGEDYVVTGAIRVDYVDYNGYQFADPVNPFGPVNDGVIDEEDMVESDAEISVSPRLSVAWQPSELLSLYASGAILWQSSPLNVYNGIAFLETRLGAGSFYPFGFPPEKQQRALALEAGGAIRPNDQFKFRAGLGYRDFQNLIQLGHIEATPFAYDVNTAEAIGDAFQSHAGVTFKPQPFLTLSADYQIGFVRATVADYPNIAWKNPQGAPEVVEPTEWDQTHKFVGVFDLHTGPGEGPGGGNSKLLENTSLVATVYAASGFRFTRTNPYDAVTGGSVSITPATTYNNSRQPMILQVDLKLERTIPIDRFNVVPFLWVRNLLDRKNIAYVYGGTGEPDRTGYYESEEGQYRADDPNTGDAFTEAYKLREKDPTNYAPPRQIYLGLRVEF